MTDRATVRLREGEATMPSMGTSSLDDYFLQLDATYRRAVHPWCLKWDHHRRYWCGLDRLHDGEHQAINGGFVIARWIDLEEQS